LVFLSYVNVLLFALVSWVPWRSKRILIARGEPKEESWIRGRGEQED
jgi:hypothetical protein